MASMSGSVDPDISVKSGTFPAYENPPSMIFSCLQLLFFTIQEYVSFSPARLPLNIYSLDYFKVIQNSYRLKILAMCTLLRTLERTKLWSEVSSYPLCSWTHSSNSPNTLQTSNFWMNMSCLHPIRTWFFVTCLRLDVPDGLHRSAIFGESLPVWGN